MFPYRDVPTLLLSVHLLRDDGLQSTSPSRHHIHADMLVHDAFSVRNNIKSALSRGFIILPPRHFWIQARLPDGRVHPTLWLNAVTQPDIDAWQRYGATCSVMWFSSKVPGCGLGGTPMSFVDGTKMLRRSYRRLRATEEPRSRVPALARHSSLRHAPGIVMEVTAADRGSAKHHVGALGRADAGGACHQQTPWPVDHLPGGPERLARADAVPRQGLLRRQCRTVRPTDRGPDHSLLPCRMRWL